MIAREHTMRTLLETDYFTADDLEPIGIPEHYRRSVHGLVTAYFRGPEPLMDEAGRRKSERPERKGAKNTIFRISAKGRRELPKLLVDLRATLVGFDAGGQRGQASVEPGEKSSTGQAQGKSEQGRISSPSSVAGAGSPDSSLTLFGGGSASADSDQRAA